MLADWLVDCVELAPEDVGRYVERLRMDPEAEPDLVNRLEAIVLSPDPGPTTHKSRDVVGGIYRLEKRLASGAMGDIWTARVIAEDPDRNMTRVAVKFAGNFSIDAAVDEMFEKEIAALRDLHHRNIVRIHAASRAERYVVMDYVEGETLAEWFQREKLTGRIASNAYRFQALMIARQIVDAVGYAHDQRICHRDLKPNNVILRGSACPTVIDDHELLCEHTAVVIDFGLSLIGGSRPHPVQAAAAKYSSAAILDGDSATQPDIWALGAILYELITGETPYDSQQSFENEWHRAVDEHVGCESVPQRIVDLCDRCLTKPTEIKGVVRYHCRNGHEQFKTVAQLREALDVCILELTNADEVAPSNIVPRAEVDDRHPQLSSAKSVNRSGVTIGFSVVIASILISLTLWSFKPNAGTVESRDRVAALKVLLKANPEDVESRYELAREYLRRSERINAVNEYTLVIQQTKIHRLLLLSSVQRAATWRNHMLAGADINSVVQLTSLDFVELLESLHAVEPFAEGTLAKYKPLIHEQRGWIHGINGEMELAISEYEKCLELVDKETELAATSQIGVGLARIGLQEFRTGAKQVLEGLSTIRGVDMEVFQKEFDYNFYLIAMWLKYVGTSDEDFSTEEIDEAIENTMRLREWVSLASRREILGVLATLLAKKGDWVGAASFANSAGQSRNLIGEVNDLSVDLDKLKECIRNKKTYREDKEWMNQFRKGSEPSARD